MPELLRIENLKTYFKTERGLVKAVDGVSLKVNEAEIVGIVGESGCGKSVTMLSAVQLVATPPGKIINGKVIFEGSNLLEFESKGIELSQIRGGKIGMIFQEPMTSLNPVLTIGRQITETLELHLKMDKQQSRAKAEQLLQQVGISDGASRLKAYPHQFSGGMRQRVMIAIGLSCNPRILIADEPTTALDVTTQAQLLELMKNQVSKLKAALIIVTHNLGVVARYVQRIYVMYAGRVIETGLSRAIFENPRHPYTIALLKSVPILGETRSKRKLISIIGMPPNLVDMPPTCAFRPRCSHYTAKCNKEPWPELREVGEDHYAACYVDVNGK